MQPNLAAHAMWRADLPDTHASAGRHGCRRLGRRRRRACRRLRSRGGCRFGGFFLGLALLAWHRLFGIVALRALENARGVEETHDAIRRLRAFSHPRLHFFQIELQPLGLFLRQQRIEIAEALDETAVTRRAAVGDNDVIERPLFCSSARHTDHERHWLPFIAPKSVTSSSPLRADREVREISACRPVVRGDSAAGPACSAAGRLRPAFLAAIRRAFFWQARPSAPGSACRRQARACWRARPWVRASLRPWPSSCPPWCDAFSGAG